jgi:hypothetical protein
MTDNLRQRMNIEELWERDDPTQLGSKHLQAIWYDLHGDWNSAHNIVQQMSDEFAMWIHAYLHRKEPDIWNAKYWYRACGHPYPGDLSFDQELESILIGLS